MAEDKRLTVLHYVGCDADCGGILSVVRALADAGEFGCVLGANPGFVQTREPRLDVLNLPRIAGESITPLSMWRARRVAQAAREWLLGGTNRVFHGHSRTGMLVALWLQHLGEQRVVVTVHCYGRQRWFYRWAAGRLGGNLHWLSPAMRRHYGVAGQGWDQCLPGCVPARGMDLLHAAPGEVRQLGGIGMLVRWKNWHLVLEALSLLPPAQRRRLRFRHIGGTDGSEASRRYSAELRARTTTAGLDGVVEWLGEQPSSTPLLQTVDCLVVASEKEPFSVAMLEALHAGVPVLAADSGGAVDVVGEGRNGWLFRSGDARDLARRLAQLADTGVPATMVIDREGLQRFTAPAAAAAHMKVYRRVCGS